MDVVQSIQLKSI